jgi:nucleoside-triphosphatase THEP1
MTESMVIIVSGGIGSGKTTSLIEARRWALESNLGTAGVISPRNFDRNRLIGYDALDCSTGDVFPLARLREFSAGEDWMEFDGLGYLFSAVGFRRANEILFDVKQTESRVIMVDEIGRLELDGGGLMPGLEAVLTSESTWRGAILISCRLQALELTRSMARRLQEDIVLWSPDSGDELSRILSSHLI